MREAGLTPAPAILDSRKQRFSARLSNACINKFKELHKSPGSGATIYRAVKKDHEHGRPTEGMNWLADWLAGIQGEAYLEPGPEQTLLRRTIK
jgi:hypothetical protein